MGLKEILDNVNNEVLWRTVSRAEELHPEMKGCGGMIEERPKAESSWWTRNLQPLRVGKRKMLQEKGVSWTLSPRLGVLERCLRFGVLAGIPLFSLVQPSSLHKVTPGESRLIGQTQTRRENRLRGPECAKNCVCVRVFERKPLSFFVIETHLQRWLLRISFEIFTCSSKLAVWSSS